jgi:hypothetical protein
MSRQKLRAPTEEMRDNVASAKMRLADAADAMDDVVGFLAATCSAMHPVRIRAARLMVKVASLHNTLEEKLLTSRTQ